MAHDVSPTARALLALEVIQNSPGITAHRLGDRLGVTERAARRYVAILREADLPIESVSGPQGGYRVGRGLRLPPLMFTAAEAMGLAMAVLEGHRNAANPTDLVGSALAKIVRVLPERVAGPVRAFRQVSAPRAAHETWASPELMAQLIESCTAARRLRLVYRMGEAAGRVMEVHAGGASVPGLDPPGRCPGRCHRRGDVPMGAEKSGTPGTGRRGPGTSAGDD